MKVTRTPKQRRIFRYNPINGAFYQNSEKAIVFYLTSKGEIKVAYKNRYNLDDDFLTDTEKHSLTIETIGQLKKSENPNQLLATLFYNLLYWDQLKSILDCVGIELTDAELIYESKQIAEKLSFWLSYEKAKPCCRFVIYDKDGSELYV